MADKEKTKKAKQPDMTPPPKSQKPGPTGQPESEERQESSHPADENLFEQAAAEDERKGHGVRGDSLRTPPIERGEVPDTTRYDRPPTDAAARRAPSPVPTTGKKVPMRKFRLLASTHTEPVYDEKGQVVKDDRGFPVSQEHDTAGGKRPVVKSPHNLVELFPNKFEPIHRGDPELPEEPDEEDVTEDFDAGDHTVAKTEDGYIVRGPDGEPVRKTPYGSKRDVHAALRKFAKRGEE